MYSISKLSKQCIRFQLLHKHCEPYFFLLFLCAFQIIFRPTIHIFGNYKNVNCILISSTFQTIVETIENIITYTILMGIQPAKNKQANKSMRKQKLNIFSFALFQSLLVFTERIQRLDQLILRLCSYLNVYLYRSF